MGKENEKERDRTEIAKVNPGCRLEILREEVVIIEEKHMIQNCRTVQIIKNCNKNDVEANKLKRQHYDMYEGPYI